jgi:hypothetical protein
MFITSMDKTTKNRTASSVSLRVAAIALVAALGLAACGTDQRTITQEQAEQAFMVSYAAMFVGSMSAALQHDRAGISVNRAERTITLTEFDVTDLQTPYESVSGTITGEDGSSLVEFTLVGGPATEVSFQIAADQMIVGDRIEQSVEVNGRSFEIDLDRSALEL